MPSPSRLFTDFLGRQEVDVELRFLPPSPAPIFRLLLADKVDGWIDLPY